MFKKATKIQNERRIKFDYFLDHETLKAKTCDATAILGWSEIILLKEGYNGTLDTMMAKCGDTAVIYFGKWNDGIF